METDAHRCNLFLIIHHPQKNEFLLHTNPSRGQLPCFVTPVRARQFFFEETVNFLPELCEHFRFTFEINLLRCMWYKNYNKKENADDIFSAIIVLEAHGESLDPPNGTEWMNASNIIFPEAALSDGRKAVNQFADEVRTGLQPALRPLHARPGWYESSVEWMKNQLSLNGFQSVESVTQVSCTYRGTTLRAKMKGGTHAYLKCSHFANEAAVCNALSDVDPKLVAKPIATDVKRRLLLMRDYGEITSPFEFDDLETIQWVRELARFHQSTIGKKDVLQDAGLRVITCEVILAKFEKAFSLAFQLQLLNTAMMQKLDELSNEIRVDCEAFIVLGIPATFVHGDLYFSNVYRTSDSEVSHGIMDFGECAISHPFFDGLACRNMEAHSEAWLEFLQRNFRNAAERVSKKQILACRRRLGRLRPLWEVMRLYHEMDSVESLAPPEMMVTFQGEMLCLLRSYKQHCEDCGRSASS